MALSFLQANSSSADLTTYTFAAENLGATAGDRYIVVCFQTRAGGSRTVDSVTVGGVSATIVRQRQAGPTSSQDVACIAIAAVPTGATGDVVVTMSAACLRAAIQLYRLTGIASATAYDSDDSAADDPTAAVDFPAGGMGVGCAVTLASTTATWTGLTEDHDSVVESVITVGSASQSVVGADPGRSLLCNFAAPGASTSVGIFAVWEPAATTVTCTLTATQAGDTCSATAAVTVATSLAQTQAGDSASATAAVQVGASAGPTQAGDSVSGAAAVVVGAGGSATGSGDTGSGAAAALVVAGLTVTQAGDSLAATVATAAVSLPAAGDVRAGVEYDSDTLPDPGDVRAGVTYG